MVSQLIVKPGLVRTLIAAHIPEEVGEGGSRTGSGIGALNRYLWE